MPNEISFHAARKKFLDGTDTPVAYLERCIRTIEELSGIPELSARRLKQREEARSHFSSFSGLSDAVITLSSLGPAPAWKNEDGEARSHTPTPTGDSSFNVQASALGATAVTMPMLCVGGMPLGIQLLGQADNDAKLCAFSSRASQTLKPVVIEDKS